MTNQKTEAYFETIFFKTVWPLLTGTKTSPPIGADFHNSEEIARVLWKSIIPTLDNFIRKYVVPTKKSGGQTDNQFFASVVRRLHELRKQGANGERWQDCWPSTAIKSGGTNCSLGSQIAGRSLQKAGYAVEYGMPGPMSHAVIMAKTSDNEMCYLDPANGVTAKVAAEEVIDGVKSYRLETHNENVPFRLVPVCALEKSVATTIWNLASLRQDALSSDSEKQQTAFQIMDKFGLERDIPYSDWAKNTILPEWNNLLKCPAWRTEQEKSGERIRLSSR